MDFGYFGLGYFGTLGILSLGILSLGILGLWVFWDFGYFGLGYFGLGYFGVEPVNTIGPLDTISIDFALLLTFECVIKCLLPDFLQQKIL